jgi:hypothetical protein
MIISAAKSKVGIIKDLLNDHQLSYFPKSSNRISFLSFEFDLSQCMGSSDKICQDYNYK